MDSVADDRAWQVLRPLLDSAGAAGYLPWTEGAIRPAALVRIANEIVFADRREIVELGSGISTVVLARLLRERGGRITAVEHEPNWAAVVGRQLALEDLGDVARLVEAPLEPTALSAEGAPWYADAALDQLPVSGIELLLIDGPPGYGPGMAQSRYPGLPNLIDRLAPGCLVILDDAARPGERAIITRWEAENPGWRFAGPDAGLAVATAPPQ